MGQLTALFMKTPDCLALRVRAKPDFHYDGIQVRSDLDYLPRRSLSIGSSETVLTFCADRKNGLPDPARDVALVMIGWTDVDRVSQALPPLKFLSIEEIKRP